MSVAQEGGGGHPGQGWLTAQVKTNGTLSFSCRWKKSVGSEEPDSWLAIGFADGDGQFNNDNKYKMQTIILDTTAWRRVDIPVHLVEGFSQLNIHLGNYIGIPGDSIEIDQVVWIPEGTDPGGDEPQPGKDEPTVTGITFENGKLVIRSTGDAKFGYQVLSAPSLEAPIEWTPLSSSYQEGLDVGQRFELTVDPAEPQMFYKVEVLKKR